MHWILLPLIATVSLAPPAAAPMGSEPLPAAYRPCDGTVPVFNPEGCPAPGLVLAPREEKRDAPCRDRIRQVRAASGQPRLESLPASPERPYLIAAVDRRIDGCSMMQIHGSASDVRPLPSAPEGRVLLHPAH